MRKRYECTRIFVKTEKKSYVFMCGQGLSYNVHLLLAKSEELVCRRKMAVIFNMINLFCELWKSWMYFSQGILRETHRSFFKLNFILFY